MIVILDGTKYYIDEDKIIDYCKTKIDMGLGKKIKIPRGPTIDLTGKGIISTALRQIASFAIPVLEWAANRVDVQLPPVVRHQDSIRYVVNAYFMLLKRAMSDSEVEVTSERYVDDMMIITAYDIRAEDAKLPLLLLSDDHMFPKEEFE